MLAIFYAVVKESKDKKSDKDNFSKNKIVPVTVFSFLVLAFMFVVLARIFGGYILYYKAMKTLKPGSFSSSLKILDKAKVLDPWSSYLPAGAGSIHMVEYGNTRLKELLKLAAMDYLEAIRRSPRVYYNYFALGKIYEALGDTARGQIFTQKAKELSPVEFVSDNRMFLSSSK